MQTFKKLLFLLNHQERKQAGMLLFMIFIMALLDTIGVASILPFMAVLTNPSLIETNSFLNTIFQISNDFGIKDRNQFIFVLGLAVLLLLIISLAFKSLTTYVQVRFVHMREHSIGKKLVEGYLNQPYSWFLSRHSADLGKTILSEVSIIIANGIAPFMDMIAKGLVAILLITLLIIADPKIALFVGISFGGAYGIIFYFIRGYINRIGNERLENNQVRFTTLSEAFGATKEIKVGGLEKIYIKAYSDSSKIYARTVASQLLISHLPRYILEAVAFGGILIIILYTITLTGSFNSTLPILSLYVFAGYRLMPALQQIYSSFTSLSFIGPSLDKLLFDLKNLKKFKVNTEQSFLTLNKKITLKNIYYNYPNESRLALKDININIPAKSIVGFIGTTGSGKTTMIDIILGLLEAQKGTLEVDGEIISNHNLRSWQDSIGYVPQNIYLTDNTISANIGFGIEDKNINKASVEKAAKIANLHNFIINELPNQYQTIIGENGARLSGGQRQRLGIARALYHNPKVLIFDEATSALDNETEKIVMDAVNNFSKNITLIIIAHRINALKKCNKIFKIDKGQIVAEGTFDELVNSNN